MENMEKLLEALRSMESNELDEILDKRDTDPFDSAWGDLYQISSGTDVSFDNKALFLKLSETTNCHEICSYISDDFELICRSEALGVKSEFLNYLKRSYEQGIVPSEWQK